MCHACHVTSLPIRQKWRITVKIFFKIIELCIFPRKNVLWQQNWKIKTWLGCNYRMKRILIFYCCSFPKILKEKRLNISISCLFEVLLTRAFKSLFCGLDRNFTYFFSHDWSFGLHFLNLTLLFDSFPKMCIFVKLRRFKQ